MQKLFLMSVAPLEDENLFKTAYDLVSDIRKQKTDKFVLAKDKHLCVGAGLLLQYALGTENIELVYGKYKKPFLKNGKKYFNISHSKDYAICVVGDCENGCDIEKIADYDDAVAKRVLTKSEYENLCDSEDKNKRFFEYWTMKESYTKAVGCGLHIAPNELDLQTDCADWVFSKFDVADYIISVCSKDACADLENVNIENIIRGHKI